MRDPTQAVGTLSGGERQCVAIARAVYFGARVLILDEPTSALGVKQASVVLRYVAQARARGLGVIFITHNVHHAYPVGDAFTILNRGRTYGTFQKDEVTREEVLNMMAGGKELDELSAELEEFARADTGRRLAARSRQPPPSMRWPRGSTRHPTRSTSTERCEPAGFAAPRGPHSRGPCARRPPRPPQRPGSAPDQRAGLLLGRIADRRL